MEKKVWNPMSRFNIPSNECPSFELVLIYGSYAL